jgi:hypothetical protein
MKAHMLGLARKSAAARKHRALGLLGPSGLLRNL